MENKDYIEGIINGLKITSGIFIIVLLFIAININSKIDRLGFPKNEVTIEQVDWAFEDSVKNYIKELNIKHPDIVFRQAILESGNFQSAVFKDNNNMFGFKQAYKRPNVQKGTNRGYAVYGTWQECVIDYALYQTYSAKNMSKEQYILFLGRHYAEDPEYSNKISN